jgi:alpha-galactosidase
MEPEMVSPDSDLYRAHPDWAVAVPARKPQLSRYELILDVSREDVQDYLIEQISAVLSESKASYLKWDFNRNISDKYSHALPADRQGEFAHRFVLGTYRILGALEERFPELLIEGCSGGGGRFDAGMLYYSPQIWCSDNTDAIDRLAIQYGTSFGYPASTVGAHVSACPNHQTGRVTPLATRAAVAMAGTFGYELDPAKLSAEEREEIRRQTAAYHEDAPLIQDGLYYRLSDPASELCCAWAIVSESGDRCLLSAVLQNGRGYLPAIYVKPRGLTPGALYRERESGRVYPADALMDAGLPFPQPAAEYASHIWHLDRV